MSPRSASRVVHKGTPEEIVVMSRPLKSSKLSEARTQENMDRISSLPDELIAHLLSFLPAKCTVATSILSSRWRCLHTLANCLSFELHGYFIGDYITRKRNFRKFVNTVLQFHKISPIRKFHLDCSRHMYDVSELHDWINFARSKNVEQLHLSLGERRLNALPHCLFTCQTIVELKIDSYLIGLQVPESIHLPNLKILHLGQQTCVFDGDSFLDGDSFVRLVSACPMLQVLDVKRCRLSYHHLRVSLRELKRLTLSLHKGRFEVDAPKLVYIDIYCANSAYIDLKTPERLVMAHVKLNFHDNYKLQHSLLIKAVHYVKELDLVLGDVKHRASSEDDHLPSFPNLTKLSFEGCSYDTWKYVTHLLANSPRLETVVFKGLTKASKREKWPTNVALVSFSSCVKVIEVFRFCGGKTELVLLKYLLGNADELNMLIVNEGKMKEKQTLEARKKLLKFPRASKTCEIQLIGEI